MDDFSVDSTKDILNDLHYKNITVLHNKQSTGLVSCYIYGYKHCISKEYDYIVEMDSGFSHRPEHLKSFLENLDSGYDAVFGSRFLKYSNYETTFFRRFVSRIGTIVANNWLGMNYSDSTSGYQAFKIKAIRDFNFDNFISSGGMFQTEIKYYIYDRRTKTVEQEINEASYYESKYRNFFSDRFFDRKYCYRYKLKEVPINFISSETSFRTVWVLDGIKILLKLKNNVKRIYDEKG